MLAGVSRGMAALLTDVDFVSALFVSVGDVHVVNFATVGFKGAPLGKRSVTLTTCVRLHTWKTKPISSVINHAM